MLRVLREDKEVLQAKRIGLENLRRDLYDRNFEVRLHGPNK
jgi:hypothetical protein